MIMLELYPLRPDATEALDNSDISRTITKEEMKEAIDYAKKLKINFIT